MSWFFSAFTFIWDWITNVFISMPTYVFEQYVIPLLGEVGIDVSAHIENSEVIYPMFAWLQFVLPLNGIIMAMITTMSVIVTIRTVRWTLAMVPTIGG